MQTDTIPLGPGLSPAKLPYTRRPTPDVRWCVTGMQSHQGMEGVAYSATTRFDGKIVGRIQNEGSGGPTMFRGDSRDANVAWAAFWPAFAELNGLTSEPEAEACELLVNEYDVAKVMKRPLKLGEHIACKGREAYPWEDPNEVPAEPGFIDFRFAAVAHSRAELAKAWAGWWLWVPQTDGGTWELL